MPVEVDEHQLANLQNTAKIVQGLLQNPKTRGKVLAAYKEAHPNAHVPEIDGQAPVMQRIEGIEKAVVQFINESREQAQKKEVDQQISRLRSDQEKGRKLLRDKGYTAEGIKALEEFRDTKGLVEYEDAVRLYELDNPPPQVNDPSGLGGHNFFEAIKHEADQNDFHKHLFETQGNNDGVVEREAMNAIRELRGAGSRR